MSMKLILFSFKSKAVTHRMYSIALVVECIVKVSQCISIDHKFHVWFVYIYRGNSNERQFLKDFVGAVPGSSGERLACWLQPDRRLDPNKCELKAISEPVRFGWPTHLTVITRDQYGDPVYVPNLKVCIDFFRYFPTE